LIVLGLVVYFIASVISMPIPSSLPVPSQVPVSVPAVATLVAYLGLLLMGLGLLGVLVGAVRRNMYTYLIGDRDVVVQKQLLRRSVRRIPFSSISDIQVSETIIGRIVGYGNIAPVTKSGYGLVKGTQKGENVVQEMINVPKPDKVADLIMSRASTTTETRTGT
jgi:uncharacterized membrane protein YdbT with pleckstrin-like domain